MKSSPFPPAARAKAVWGPRRVAGFVALVAVSCGFALNANAQGRHRQTLPHVPPGTENTFVNRDKMDDEVARRASGVKPMGLSLGLGTADVIVTLEQGADLPAAFQ